MFSDKRKGEVVSRRQRTVLNGLKIVPFCIACIFNSFYGFAFPKISSTIKPRFSITVDEGVKFLQSLLYSNSVEKIIDFLQNFPDDVSYGIVRRIVNDSHSVLNVVDKQILILALAEKFSHDVNLRNKILDLLLSFKGKLDGGELLLEVIKRGYGEHLPFLIEWMGKNELLNPGLKKAKKRMVAKLIDSDDKDVLYKLKEYKVGVSPKEAQSFLWYVIENNKAPELITFFVGYGADLNGIKDGHTLVTKATENGNLEMVQALVGELKKKGAQQKDIADFLERFANPMVGTPLQIALANGFSGIAFYLQIGFKQ